MKKSSTINLRIDPKVKSQAEKVLRNLGIPMSTAIDIFLKQIVLSNGIPFPVVIPKPPADIDVSQMTDEQLHEKLKRGYEDCKDGRTQNADEAFENFINTHK